ncbi:MAG: hypothetical protein ACTSYA_05675 [Candidatus Kariarchaeaceae archaeon]
MKETRRVTKNSVWNIPETDDRRKARMGIDRKFSTICPNDICNRKIFEGVLGDGTNIEIKCPQCKQFFPKKVGVAKSVPIDRKCSSVCANCGHPAFFGIMGKRTNIEVLCSKCDKKYYERAL